MPETIWSRPLSQGPMRTRLIECLVGMCDDDSGDYLTAHWLFAKKVLRETNQTAFALAARFRKNKLTVEACELLADEWWEPAVAAREEGTER